MDSLELLEGSQLQKMRIEIFNGKCDESLIQTTFNPPKNCNLHENFLIQTSVCNISTMISSHGCMIEEEKYFYSIWIPTHHSKHLFLCGGKRWEFCFFLFCVTHSDDLRVNKWRENLNLKNIDLKKNRIAFFSKVC